MLGPVKTEFLPLLPPKKRGVTRKMSCQQHSLKYGEHPYSGHISSSICRKNGGCPSHIHELSVTTDVRGC